MIKTYKIKNLVVYLHPKFLIMSLINQEKESQDFIKNPCKKFLTLKSVNDIEEITTKGGGKKEIKVLSGAEFEYSIPGENEGEWIKKEVKLPLEFIILDDSWTNYKGWNDEKKMYYRSNEVNQNDQLITIKGKDGVVFEFTKDQYWGNIPNSKIKDEETSKRIKDTLKTLNVSEHGSIYIAMKNEDGEFEIVNLQLKGTNLRGSKDYPNDGWRKFSTKLKNSGVKYSNYIQINDWTTGESNLGDFVILNYSIGEVIPEDDMQKAIELGTELENYHNQYIKEEVNTDY